MISVILYGRNDSYGYNLHKRAALSLNCIAELLTHEQDEILFVDYNTPDDFPTFPEAIQDTLTPRARRLLRVLRVRQKHHQRFKDQTHLVALEPVARNVAVRRSNPANRWILSTNTDMIFVPRAARSLSEITSDLPAGFYHLPRFEVPESLWESLDRMDPSGTIAAIEAWGRAFHLNEVVHAHDPWVKFDGPGDFQLILRDDLFRISGFHEGMLLGWHVDSNIARRLNLLHGKTSDLLAELFGYHCDHTRQVTPAHRAGSVQNDVVAFNDLVTQPLLPEQAETWGLAGETIEELTADTTSSLYVGGLRSVIAQEMAEPSHVVYGAATYDHVTYDVPHVLPFLTDIFASYPRDTKIGWYGARCELLAAFAEASRRMGFTGPILVAAGAAWLGDLPAGCAWTDAELLQESADVYVFDCASSADPSTANDTLQTSESFVAGGLLRAVRAERARLMDRDALPRRFIAVNAIHNRFEGLMTGRIGAARSPMASRIRQGFVMAGDTRAEKRDLLPLFAIGGAGERRDGRIVSIPGKAGPVVYGPYLALDPGHYRLILTLERPAPGKSDHSDPLALEILASNCLIGLRAVGAADVAAGSVSMPFTISNDLVDAIPWLQVEFRLRTEGKTPVSLVGATLERLPEQAGAAACEYDWMPWVTCLHTAAGNGWRARSANIAVDRGVPRLASSLKRIDVARGPAGHVVYGPYVALPPGHYEAVFGLRFANPWRRTGTHDASVALEVARDQGAVFLAHRFVRPDTQGNSIHVLPFEVSSEDASRGGIEFRLWSDGSVPFAVEAITTKRITAQDYE